jgi:hypothetical protein
MLLQTNSYIVPKDKRAEHARLLRRFRAALAKLGCDSFEIYEQVGANWNTGEPTGRYVQIMRFRDRRHQVAVQHAERNDSAAQAIIAEFCQLINFPYQQQQGLFAVGFYNSVLPVAPVRGHGADAAAVTPAVEDEQQAAPEAAGADEPAAPEAQLAEEPVAEEPAEEFAAAEPATEEVAAEEPAAEALPEEPAPPAEAAADEDQPSESDEVADLGALLDAHLTRPLDDDASGLGNLDLPDEPASDSHRAADHAAR